MADNGSNGIGAAFGVYDFFAYILPGLLAIVPIAFHPLFRDWHPPLGGDVMLAILVLSSAYLVGLAIHAAGMRIERLFEKEYPSRAALSKLPAELQDKLRRLLREHFDLSIEANDGLLWDLANRYLVNKGLSQRVHTFMMLHLVSRGLLAVLVWYGLVASYLAFTQDWRWAVVLGAIVGAWVLFNRLRAAFNARVAEEVLLTYYTARRSEPG